MAIYQALAADGDGTLTTRGRMPSRTVRALQQLREAGGKILLVTGERLEKAEHFPHVDLFDRVVAENGALLLNPSTGRHRPLCPPRPPQLLPALQARVSCISGGRIAMMCKASQRNAVDKALRELGSDWRTVPNRRDLLVLPPGVSKATGLAAALEELGLSTSHVVSVGDAENDLPMLECCGLGAAVANAVPLLKQAARLVLTRRAGQGVQELIDRLLRDDLPVGDVHCSCATALDDGGMQVLAAAFRPRPGEHAASQNYF
jgi:hydroxymethylpyrimidine pyrophosphatase-like HAD family hydrolase